MVITFWVIFINLTYSFSALLSTPTTGLPAVASREGGCTLRSLLLDPFYGVQGKFLKIFGGISHECTRIDTKMEEARQPRMTRITRISRGALWCAALLRRFYLSAIKLAAIASLKNRRGRRERRKSDGMNRTVRMIFADSVHSVRKHPCHPCNPWLNRSVGV